MNVSEVACPDCRKLIAWRRPDATELSREVLSWAHWTHRPLHGTEVAPENAEAAAEAWAAWEALDPTKRSAS